MAWSPFVNGKSVGLPGSEGGIIILDEEHHNGARITLERDGQTAPFSITCGIYGWMLHTRFFGKEAEAQDEFKRMRSELTKILDLTPLVSDPEADQKRDVVIESISQFTGRSPT
jgi:hypothetical protein